MNTKYTLLYDAYFFKSTPPAALKGSFQHLADNIKDELKICLKKCNADLLFLGMEIEDITRVVISYEIYSNELLEKTTSLILCSS